MKQVAPFRHSRGPAEASPINAWIRVLVVLVLAAYIARAALHLHQLLIAAKP
jgi:hypothetical protein